MDKLTVMMGRKFLPPAFGGSTLLDLSFQRSGTRRRCASPEGREYDGEGTDRYSAAKGGMSRRKSRQDGKEWIASFPRTFQDHPEEGNGRAFSGKYDKHYEGGLPVRVLRDGPVPFGGQVRFRTDGQAHAPIAKENIRTESDWVCSLKTGALRRCDAHLGHVFGTGETDRASLLLELAALTFAKVEMEGK
jgi:peptide methionine sulfoxide reductase MsrB